MFGITTRYFVACAANLKACFKAGQHITGLGILLNKPNLFWFHPRRKTKNIRILSLAGSVFRISSGYTCVQRASGLTDTAPSLSSD